MAEHTKAHLWLNTLIACLALAASSGSAIFSWRSFLLKDESLAFVSRATFDCALEHYPQKLDDTTISYGAIGFCWMVTISNQSESRVSLVTHGASQLLKGERSVFYSGFTEIEDTTGSQAPFPIVFDPGASRRFVFRVPIGVPASVLGVIKELQETNKSRPIKLIELQLALGKRNLDLIGNPLGAKISEDEWIVVSNMSSVVGRTTFETGRGKRFTAEMDFPIFGLQLFVSYLNRGFIDESGHIQP